MRNSCGNLTAMIGLVLSVVTTAQADSLQDQLTRVLQENFDAANHEDLGRLMATMSAEMPLRQEFMQQCKDEWETSDLYYRLEELKPLKDPSVRPPYAAARIVQTITGGNGAVEEESDSWSLRTAHETTWLVILFKKEKGKWKVVESLTEPAPLEQVGNKESVDHAQVVQGE